MKKVFLLILFASIILIFNLSACAKPTKGFEFSQKRENIQSVEIYNTEQAYYEGDIHEFRGNNEPAKVLDNQAQSEFLEVIDKLEFEKEKAFFLIPMDGGYDYSGYIIVIIYTDGGYDLIAEGGMYFYDSDNKHKYEYADYCGEIPWSEIFEEYMK